MPLIAFYIAAAAFVTAPLFHYGTLLSHQLGGYRIRETVAAFKRINKRRFVLPVGGVIFTEAVTVLTYHFVGKKFVLIALAPSFLFAAALACYRRKTSKIKLRFTSRMKRQIILFSLLSAAVAFGLAYAYPPLAVVGPSFFGFFTLAAANIVLTPFEKVRNERFIQKAKVRLNVQKPIRIGITGSYGKTTVKNFLAELLGEKYSVCATRGNYNTPMGIALTVENDLKAEDEVFIAEMGARYVGDVARLCEIVSPSIAIITSIGTQHLETFGSVERLLSAKGELIDALPSGGTAIFNGDDEGSVKLYERCKTERLLVGCDETAVRKMNQGKRALSRFDVFYGNASYDERGCSFTLVIGGKAHEIVTPLLGEYVPQSIALCAACAMRLGVSAEKIKFRASKLKAVAHRLELLYNGSDIIIDDAYNGSEQSVKVALRALKLFSSRTRIVVTPGVVELGKRQSEANENLGRIAAECCDFALFVGVNASSLKRGALSNGMNEAKVLAFQTLASATEKLKQIKGERAILFANDLPDNY